MKRISLSIVKAYLQCERKAYLLLFENTLNCVNNYSDMIEKNNKNNKKRYLDKLKKK